MLFRQQDYLLFIYLLANHSLDSFPRPFLLFCIRSLMFPSHPILTTNLHIYRMHVHTGVWDVSNSALARHDYTGMWKLTLLCAFVQLFGTSRCIEMRCIGLITFDSEGSLFCYISSLRYHHFAGLFFINLLPSGVKEQVSLSLSLVPCPALPCPVLPYR